MIVKISPSIANGKIKAPPSKSMAHRLLISAALSEGKSQIKQVDLSEDIVATLNCLEGLGAQYSLENDVIKIRGIKLDTNSAYNLNKETQPQKLDCNESGSTLRFLIPIALLFNKPVIFQGKKRLFERPLSVYEDIFLKDPEIQFNKTENGIFVKGYLKADDYKIPGDISSQFITGLLFALPTLNNNSSSIQIKAPIESLSYLLLTLDALKAFGIQIELEPNKINPDKDLLLTIPGRQKYQAGIHTVEGDYSNAAFFSALNYLRSDNKVEVTNLRESSLQGDKVFPEIFNKLASAKDENTIISLADCPDLAPIAFTVAAALNGAIFTDTKRLAIKESDRAKVMAMELEKFGAKILVEENQVTIKKANLSKPKQALLGHNDHRIVMSLAILASLYGGTIEGAAAVNKSFPDFFKVLANCGIDIEIVEE